MLQIVVRNSSYDAAIKPMFESLGWKTIQQLINTQSKIVIFKSLNKHAPKYLCELFTKNSACSSRNLSQKAFSFRGAKILNSLSTEAKLAPTLYKFKKHLGK